MVSLQKPTIIRTYYDTIQSKVKEEYFQLNGKKEGEYKMYHQNGNLLKHCNYINGLSEGLF